MHRFELKESLFVKLLHVKKMHCFVDCPTAVIVEVENDVKDFQDGLAGRYERSNDVNGKPSYKIGERAIWYNKEINNWIIGYFDSIGSDVGKSNYKLKILPLDGMILCYSTSMGPC